MTGTPTTSLTSVHAVSTSDASWEYGPTDWARLKERAVFYAHAADSGKVLIGESMTPA